MYFIVGDNFTFHYFYVFLYIIVTRFLDFNGLLRSSFRILRVITQLFSHSEYHYRIISKRLKRKTCGANLSKDFQSISKVHEVWKKDIVILFFSFPLGCVGVQKNGVRQTNCFLRVAATKLSRFTLYFFHKLRLKEKNLLDPIVLANVAVISIFTKIPFHPWI